MQEYNIPFNQLEVIGLSREILEKMPEEFIRDLKSGALTALVITQIKAANGAQVEMPVKLKLGLDENGREKLTVFPVNREFTNELKLDNELFTRLRSGDILHYQGEYLQRDPETNSILRVSDEEMKIEQRFADIEKFHDIELGIEQKNQLKNGKPVVLDIGGEEVVVDLDLKNPNFYKSLKGDLNDWEYNKKVDYDILHPEYVGVVKTDENRWEYQQIMLADKFPQQELDSKQKQTVSSGMKR